MNWSCVLACMHSLLWMMQQSAFKLQTWYQPSVWTKTVMEYQAWATAPPAAPKGHECSSSFRVRMSRVVQGSVGYESMGSPD